MRPVLVFAAIVSAALFVSFAQSPTPTAPGDVFDHGWAGPYPNQLVSYNVKLTPATGSGWGTTVTVVPTVPGNGMVITGITAVSGSDTYSTWHTFQIRMMQNTTTQVGQWGFATPYYQASKGESVNLGTGIPIPKGVPLTIQANSKNGVMPLRVTITGYTW